MFLSELQNELKKDEFVKSILKNIDINYNKKQELNHGTKTTKELIDRIKKGEKISFDYKYLVEHTKDI